MQDIPYDVSHVPIDYDETVNVNEVSITISRKDERRERREQRAALERDVSLLQKQLIIEINMRNALNRGLSRPLGSLPRIYASLPVETRDLLLEVAVLEEEIVSLEKQAIHLGREIEIEVMPATDKETIWQNPNQNISPKKVEFLDSPSVSPIDSARMNSKHSQLSPRKSIDQKRNLSKPSLSARKSIENKSSSIKVSVPPRKSLDNSSSMKSSKSPKDSSEPRRTFGPSQKSQSQRDSSFPKVSFRNSSDLKSRRPSLTKKEPQEITLSPTQTVPLIPVELSTRKEDEERTPPTSPALESPSDVGNSCSQPARNKIENRKLPMTRNARFGRRDLLSNKLAPMARTVKASSTPRLPAQDKGLPDTSRLPRESLTHGTVSTRRTMRPFTATSKEKMNTQKSSSVPNPRSTPLNCDSSLQEPIDSEAGKDDTNNVDIPSTGELDEDYKLTYLSPDIEKISQPNCSPERYLKLGLEQGGDSVLLSEDVIKLLKTIYGNLQESRPPLTSDFDSSSQASISTSLSSASPDDYEIRGGANSNFRLNDCYKSGNFISKRSASMKYMRDCGEVADALDPYTCFNRGNISNRTDFQQRLMS